MAFRKQIGKILGVKFTLPNGVLAPVITGNKELSSHYDCVLCSVHKLNFHNLISHVKGAKHAENVDLVDIATVSESTAARQYAGKTSRLQVTIDGIRNKALIGVEYILDFQSKSDLEPTFRCFLCNYAFVREGQVVDHLTSFKHRLNYLENFLPNAFEEVCYLIETVCEGVENQFGRSKVKMLERSKFFKYKTKFTKMRSDSKHFGENIGCLQLIGKSGGRDINDRRSQGKCSDIVSISGESSSDSESLSARPTSATVTEQERDNKLKEFRLQATTLKNELLTTYQPYITNPYSYPDYYELWASFWNTRSKELRGDQKLKTHNYWQSEWAAEWTKIMNQKLKQEFELKCTEIKRTLGIAGAYLFETDRSTVQPPQLNAVKPTPPLSPRRSRPPRRSPKTTESPKRSRSPQRPVATISGVSGKRNLDRCRSSQEWKTAKVLPTMSTNKCQTPLRLDQLLKLHQHNADFLISWRELLRIFEIEDDGRNMNEPNESTDNSEKVPDQMELQEKSAEVQVQSVEIVEPVTVISLLRILTALEDTLGSFGPKLIHLLQTAVAMEKSTTGASNRLLDDSHNCILFETIREKLKGLFTAGLIAPNFQNMVQKSIIDMTDLINQAVERKKNCFVQTSSTPSVEKMSTGPAVYTHKDALLCPAAKEYGTEAAVDEAASLNDSEIKTLMAKFATLSEGEKNYFTTYLDRLRLNDPDRVARLKNEFAKDQTPFQITVPAREERMYYPGEVIYSEHTETAENAPTGGDYDRMAYRAAENNPGVNIKRRTRDDNGNGKWMENHLESQATTNTIYD